MIIFSIRKIIPHFSKISYEYWEFYKKLGLFLTFEIKK